ncbi:hypothetical protein F3Y22_tig00111392pilonHSYRG00628 [Hibiscus syriacus]|uniref:Histone deacetylation protein Rxt3 n=1 Tax=Hibiscus syriacus TaxID=106335 RepID=A0A6A2YLW0_HIBSY|nr:hypothetical protein F3Y22_tig00111392pilonHSYRG00628 [Hibiscus syriacus]
MSGAPKRYHEEGGGQPSSASKYPLEETAAYPKMPSSSVPAEYHHPAPYDMGQDVRMPRIPRTELHGDSGRRSPLHHSMYRMPSSVALNDTHMDSHQGFSDGRVELRDAKENREIRAESREQRVESREFFADSAKREYPSGKGEKVGSFESRGDEGKELKHDRENYGGPKGDLNVEKDFYGGASIHSSWKDSRDYIRGKRYSDPGGNIDPWHIQRANSQGTVEVVKEGSATEEKDHAEGHEAVGENTFDSKDDDRFKDKDRKRKDGKHRDWADRDKERSDRRNNVNVGNSSGEVKESAREEREMERWERERKDLKEKERPKEREKDHMKREPLNGADKEGSNNDKDLGDGSVRTQEQENQASEQKKQKDLDSWKNPDRESRDRRRERDGDTEGDRPEKRSREKEGFGSGVQQRKRMLRPRGSPQVANREHAFRPRPQDNEGCKLEVSSVVYKVGECMQELIKLWKEYEASEADKNGESSQNGPTLEIRIPAEHVTATNRQVRGGQLWGTDIYTDDSDLVAVLMHTGYCRPTASPPPPAIQELRATIRVLPPQDCYTSKLRNNVRSRAWGAGISGSYRVERCCIVKKGGATIDLEPCLTHSSTVEPTLAPVAVERPIRAAASNALRQQRFVREVTIQYNLCNEPWIKYSISIVADKGLKKPLYTSARLKKGEVLYLETHSCRYELCFTGEKMVKATTASQAHEADTEKSQSHHSHSSNSEKIDSDNVLTDVFRWSRCKKPLPQKVMRSIGIPLPLDHVEVLVENIDWEDVQWSQTGVWIAGKEYTLARVHFLSSN